MLLKLRNKFQIIPISGGRKSMWEDQKCLNLKPRHLIDCGIKINAKLCVIWKLYITLNNIKLNSKNERKSKIRLLKISIMIIITCKKMNRKPKVLAKVKKCVLGYSNFVTIKHEGMDESSISVLCKIWTNNWF